MVIIVTFVVLETLMLRYLITCVYIICVYSPPNVHIVAGRRSGVQGGLRRNRAGLLETGAAVVKTVEKFLVGLIFVIPSTDF